MTNKNITNSFLFSASERELLTLNKSDILAEVLLHYRDNRKEYQENPEGSASEKLERRMLHSSILYAEGLRLAHTHLELAKKLILASLYWQMGRAELWLRRNGEREAMIELHTKIAELEAQEETERKKAEEQSK